MSRPFTLLLLVLTFGVCSDSLALEPRASPRPGDPALDGKDYLISEADFRAILSVAGEWLARTHPWLRVRRVHVVSGDKVEVYVRDLPNPDYSEYSDLHSLELRRSKSGWRVIAHNLDRAPTID